MAAYTTNPQAIHETIDGETIIIDLASGTYYSLRGSGSEIWNALGSGEPLDALVGRLTETYDADPAEIVAALEAVLGDLEAEGLVASTNGAASLEIPAEGSRGDEPFAPPKLEKYTDMQDIILLDPVHQVDDRGWPHAAQVEPA
jgi:hypothetical protein